MMRSTLAYVVLLALLCAASAEILLPDAPQVVRQDDEPPLESAILVVTGDDKGGESIAYSNSEDVAAYLLQSDGIESVYKYSATPEMVTVTGSREAIDKLKNTPGLEVYPDPYRSLPAAVATTCACSQCSAKSTVLGGKEATPFGISMVQADNAQFNSITGGQAVKGVTVCVIDTGIDPKHVDFKGINMAGEAADGNILYEWKKPFGAYHGTHVTGTIAAQRNGKGLVGVVSGGLDMYYVNVVGAKATFPSSSIAYAWDKCVKQLRKKQKKDKGHRMVISMSVGGLQSSQAEMRLSSSFAQAQDVLMVAAAGNQGNSSSFYPAALPEVISVAAVDCNKQRASFSNFNADVELSAPGAAVLSDSPTATAQTSMSVSLTLQAGPKAGPCTQAAPNDDGVTKHRSVQAPVVDCGLALTPCPAAKGKICLIERGLNGVMFACDKIRNCMAGGGVGAIIFPTSSTCSVQRWRLNCTNTAGCKCSPKPDFIPSVAVNSAEGFSLKTFVNTNPAVVGSIAFQEQLGYSVQSGTSMATPHVSGIIARLWARFRNCPGAVIRTALRVTAQDLGTRGKDPYYGYGLVQAKDAAVWLMTQPCSK